MTITDHFEQLFYKDFLIEIVKNINGWYTAHIRDERVHQQYFQGWEITRSSKNEIISNAKKIIDELINREKNT